MSRTITIKPSKDGKAVIIGGKRYPLTRHNSEVWQQYKQDGDKDRLWSRLSKVVIS